MKYLIVVDMQNDFVDMALGSAEAVAVVPRVAQRIRLAVADGYTVIATRDTHFADYLQTREGRKLPVEHCIKDTVGWQICGSVAEACPKNMRIFDKNTFASVEMAREIAQNATQTDIEEIELIGVCTDICVVSNALLLKALLPETEISVCAECCAGVTPQSHDAAIKTMEMCQITIK